MAHNTAATTGDLPPKLARRLAGICQHCSDDAIEGSDFCAPHDAKEKGARRVRQRKLRQRRADAGECSAGCGKKVSKQRRPDGTVHPRECARCAKEHAERAKSARARVRNESRSCVTGDESTAPVKLEIGKDGATRTRYVPRPGQGGPSKEETRRSRRKLVEDAARLVALWLAHYDDAQLHEQIDAMPRVQRAEAVSLRTSPLVRALRLLGLVAEEEDGSLRGTCQGCGRGHERDEDE